MSIEFTKKGNILVPDNTNITNLYPGTQCNAAAMTVTYNVETDIFSDYGFSTCTKLAPNSTTGLAYSYILTPGNFSEPNAVYTVSLYAYASTDCNTTLQLKLEQNNIWISTYKGSAVTISETTKGKVIWMWGQFKANSSGTICLMFYPRPNGNDTTQFTAGYQLFAGISVYKGDTIYRPYNEGVHGAYTIPGQSAIRKSHIEFDDIIEI